MGAISRGSGRHRRLPARLSLLLPLAIGCERKADLPPPPAKSAVPAPCQAGRSLDPPRARAQPAERLLREQKYAEARRAFDELMAQHPESSNLRVWRGDADLLDDQDYVGSADRALVFYGEARRLDGLGCRLSDPGRYYAALHAAFAYLRKDDAVRAEIELRALARDWPTSPEVHYHLARASCLRGDAPSCYEHFARTLELSRQRMRPNFVRSHYSVADWIRRSETQSELGPLRGDARYGELVRRATGEGW